MVEPGEATPKDSPKRRLSSKQVSDPMSIYSDSPPAKKKKISPEHPMSPTPSSRIPVVATPIGFALAPPEHVASTPSACAQGAALSPPPRRGANRIRFMTPLPKSKQGSPLASTRKNKKSAKAKTAAKAAPKKKAQASKNVEETVELVAEAEKMLKDVCNTFRPKLGMPTLPPSNNCKLKIMKQRKANIRQITREGSVIGQITDTAFKFRLEVSARCLLCAAMKGFSKEQWVRIKQQLLQQQLYAD